MNKNCTQLFIGLSGSTFCSLVFVTFLINSTFALDVVNFTLRHEWHSILIDTD